MNRYAVYCGPTLVESVAHRLREHFGLDVYCEGTAHVYVRTALDTYALLRALGPSWGPRDVRQMN